MARYKTKPVEVRAWQWSGQPLQQWSEYKQDFPNAPIAYVEADNGLVYLSVQETDKTERAHPGDYILEFMGIFYVIRKHVFEQYYERLPTVTYGI